MYIYIKRRRSECDAVNYKRDALVCELLETPSIDDRILRDDSYWFANKSQRGKDDGSPIFRFLKFYFVRLCKLHITTTYK
jgi:hypothetical protein